MCIHSYVILSSQNWGHPFANRNDGDHSWWRFMAIQGYTSCHPVTSHSYFLIFTPSSVTSVCVCVCACPWACVRARSCEGLSVPEKRRRHFVCQTWHAKQEENGRKCVSTTWLHSKPENCNLRYEFITWLLISSRGDNVMQQRRLASLGAPSKRRASLSPPWTQLSLPSVSQSAAAAGLCSRRFCAFFCGVRAMNVDLCCRGARARAGSHRDLSVYWHFGSFSRRRWNQRKSVQTWSENKKERNEKIPDFNTAPQAPRTWWLCRFSINRRERTGRCLCEL